MTININKSNSNTFANVSGHTILSQQTMKVANTLTNPNYKAKQDPEHCLQHSRSRVVRRGTSSPVLA